MAVPIQNISFPPPAAIGRTAKSETTQTADGASFSQLVRQVAGQALSATNGSEEQALQSLSRGNDLVDVVTAVTNAEVTLETAMALRDRVIQAYQEIVRMPI